jgi:hypothetical protein
LRCHLASLRRLAARLAGQDRPSFGATARGQCEQRERQHGVAVRGAEKGRSHRVRGPSGASANRAVTKPLDPHAYH